MWSVSVVSVVQFSKDETTVDSFAIDFICNCSRRPPPRRPLKNDVGGAIANESTVLFSRMRKLHGRKRVPNSLREIR